jgi:hypothetical protein
VGKLALLAVIAAVSLAGCGKSSIVAVKRPVLPIYVCAIPGERPSAHCTRRFDAGQLIGLKLPAAERLAKSRGYTVLREAPVHGRFISDLMFVTDQLDVECDNTSRDCTVVRLIGRG